MCRNLSTRGENGETWCGGREPERQDDPSSFQFRCAVTCPPCQRHSKLRLHFVGFFLFTLGISQILSGFFCLQIIGVEELNSIAICVATTPCCASVPAIWFFRYQPIAETSRLRSDGTACYPDLGIMGPFFCDGSLPPTLFIGPALSRVEPTSYTCQLQLLASYFLVIDSPTGAGEAGVSPKLCWLNESVMRQMMG